MKYQKKSRPAPWTLMKIGSGHKTIDYPKDPRMKDTSSRRLYAKLIAWWKDLPENMMCCVPGCGRAADDAHHTRGRDGILLIVLRWIVPVCRYHHDLIHKQEGGMEWARWVKVKRDGHVIPLMAEEGKWGSTDLE